MAKYKVKVNIELEVDLPENVSIDSYMENADIVNIEGDGNYNYASFTGWESEKLE